MSKAAGVCPRCNGKHWKYDTSVEGEVPIPIPCVCLKSHFWANFLGHDLFNAQAVVSDLYVPVIDPETREISGDRTEDNLFIKGLWSEVKRHLKFVLYSKRKQFDGFTFRIIEDDFMFNVWVGDHAYKSQAKSVRETVVTYNSLRDLLEDPTLVVIRMGVRSTANRVASRVLMEALSIRFEMGAPTWLVEDWRAFGDGHPFYNYDVDKYIRDRFDIVDLGGDVQAEREARSIAQGLATDIAFGVDSEPPRAAPIEHKEAFVADRHSGYSKNKKWKKGSSGGGGKISGPATGL